ncbi:GlsB/YeaQ/YmgE family stress response membrane protein [Micromonosporaceae bacterium Da 78-11]
MHVSGIFTAIVIGLIIGALGRLVVPGRQNIPIWLTLLIGVAAALIGTFLAAAIGVDDTDGIDWIELALQIGLAAGGVALVAGARRRRCDLLNVWRSAHPAVW